MSDLRSMFPNRVTLQKYYTVQPSLCLDSKTGLSGGSLRRVLQGQQYFRDHTLIKNTQILYYLKFALV